MWSLTAKLFPIGYAALPEPCQPLAPIEQRDFLLRDEQLLQVGKGVRAVRRDEPVHVIDMGVRAGHGSDVLPGNPSFRKRTKQQAHGRVPRVASTCVDQDVPALLDDQEGVDRQPQLPLHEPYLFGQLRAERPVALLAQPAGWHVHMAVAKGQNGQLAELVAGEVGARPDHLQGTVLHAGGTLRADAARARMSRGVPG
nr:hypothetical protein [Geminicoccus harenae]